MSTPVPPGNDELNNVRVCVRIRPMQPFELKNGDTPTVAALPDQKSLRISSSVDNKRKVETQQIRFDQVFAPQTTQLDLFHKSGCESFCDRAIDGFATTVFCFGQTGSGKTFTMSGPSDDTHQHPESDTMGLQFRGAHYISRAVEQIQAREGPGSVIMKASYIEIYNEHVNDLLNDTTNLKVRWSQKAQSFFIENLMIVTCDGIDDVLAVLEEGANNRKRASHKLNVDSSRSHVLFTMYFERRVGESSPVKMGKINFVDLAGSEKLRDSESSGVNAVETKAINKSLFALGNVIQCLSSRTATFVPYRDSTLTKLLMDSLGGNCMTLMVACVTPSSRFTEESMRTLKYASRTSSIVNSLPSVRVDPQQLQVIELKMEVDMLRKENEELKQRLAAASIDAETPAVGGVQRLPSRSLPPPPLAPRDIATPASSVIGGGGPSSMWSSRPQSETPTDLGQIPRLRSPSSASKQLTVEQLAALEVAERVKNDNDRLRDEVAELRNLILETRERASASPRKPVPAVRPQQLAPMPSARTEPTEDVQSVSSIAGFRPAPKRAQRLNLMPMTEASGTITSTASAPVRPAFAPNPAMNRTNNSVASMPAMMPPRQGFASQPTAGDMEMQRMRQQLVQAQRELLLMRAGDGAADAANIADDGSLSYM